MIVASVTTSIEARVLARASVRHRPGGRRCGHTQGAMIDRLQAAVEALNQGDPEPLASLFAADAEWRGVSRGFLWWRDAPS